MPEGVPPRELNPGDQIGRYRIVRLLGRGGMGVVYVARDDRLDREVALKMIAGLPDDVARSRFWREARAAASVSHPHICQVFEVDESGDGIFLTMELLEGEGLDRRLMRGALPAREAVTIALGMLGALEALHARGFVHRDVKPSNVFVTPHGPKLLDFGLARPALRVSSTVDTSVTPVTEAGMIVGTPQYMAPEQITGAALDGRTDLYAVGAVIFQMLAGRPPFEGTGGDLLFAAIKENPPALQGPPEVVAIDRVIRRAMRKDANERFGSASDMSADLAAVALSGTHAGPAMPVRALTRLVVPPIRIGRTDPEVAYLSFGLAEAVSGSLATLGNIVVRAPAVAAKWNDEGSDPRQLAASADVDLIVSGTLLRSGPQLRITAQLIDASSGTVAGAATVKGSIDDIFALEDELTRAVTGLLSPQLTAQHRPASSPVRREVPANPRAFELFLRGTAEARTLTGTAVAKQLFQRAIEEDPAFAPAWAALGRAHRVWGKYYEDHDESYRLAEQAFKRAFDLSPDLPLAHRYYTHFESEAGRAPQAIVRLLKHAKTNRHDAQLFAGLVHACRYAGLLDASAAAHDEAKRLDPNVATGVEYTLALLALNSTQAQELIVKHTDSIDAPFVIGALGDAATARKALATVDPARVPPAFRRSYDAVVAQHTKPPDEAAAVIEQAMSVHTDPEALFIFGGMFVRIGRVDRGLEVAAKAVRGGYAAVLTLAHTPALDPVRDHQAFRAMQEDAGRQLQAAQQMFEAAGGPDLLGLPAATRLSN